LIVVAALAAASIGDVAIAASQKHVTRDQAWRLCKALLDKEKTPSNMTTNDRYIRGGACMMKYGYSL
jgi:hypothetical protein